MGRAAWCASPCLQDPAQNQPGCMCCDDWRKHRWGNMLGLLFEGCKDDFSRLKFARVSSLASTCADAS